MQVETAPVFPGVRGGAGARSLIRLAGRTVLAVLARLRAPPQPALNGRQDAHKCVFERSDDIRTEPGTVRCRAKHMARSGKSRAALVGVLCMLTSVSAFLDG